MPLRFNAVCRVVLLAGLIGPGAVWAAQEASEAPPHRNAREYAVASPTAWKEILALLDEWGVDTAKIDDNSQIVTSEWVEFASVQEHSGLRGIPAVFAEDAPKPIEFQLHVFVSPFAEAARVYAASTVKSRHDGREFLYHDTGLIERPLFSQLEVRLAQAGRRVRSTDIMAGCSIAPEVLADSIDRSAVAGLNDVDFFYPSPTDEATVVLDVMLAFDGVVVPRRVVSVSGASPGSTDSFARTAQSIATLWRYRPFQLNGCRFTVPATIVMSFGREGARTFFSSRTVPSLSSDVAEEEVVPLAADAVDLELPSVLKEVRPEYTSAATRRRIAGIVVLHAVVLPSGRVGDVSVTRSLDTRYGLDAAAVAALKEWTFKPGSRAGVPVAVEVTIEMEFRVGNW